MNVPVLFSWLPCIALVACSSSTVQPLASATTTPVGAARRIVDFHFVNQSNAPIDVVTQYSYPLSPLWIDDSHSCVDDGRDWDTSIEFNLLDPQVAIRAYRSLGDRCGSLSTESARVVFKDVHFKNTRGLIEGKLVGTNSRDLQLCAKQSDENDYTCVHFP
jgi:hypothetical protein